MTTSSPGNLTVLSVPDPPNDVKVVTKGSRMANISWTAAFNGNSAIQNYTVEIREVTENFRDVYCQGTVSIGTCVVSSSSTTASLTGLLPFRKYFARVFATNAVGRSNSSSIVTVTTNEEEPSDSPKSVQAIVKNSTSVSVSWAAVAKQHRNGIIKGYKVIYQALPDGDNVTSFSNISFEDQEKEDDVTLGDLIKFTNYSIRVLAFTVVGDGPSSEVKIVQTQQDEPTAPPSNVEGQSLSSKSISVTWDEVPQADQNGIITSYNISYHSLMENHRNSTAVDYPGRQVNLTGLKEFVNYSITVFASTKIEDGPASDPVYVKTAEDKPTAAPSNVRGRNTSSTSILVEWDDVPAFEQNGIITGYTIFYRSQTEGHDGSAQAGPDNRQKKLTDLRKYVNYNITIRASTSKGDGPESSPAIVVRTDQDKPTAAPSNVRGRNTSSTSILVEWDDVPAFEQNGIITGYTIIYRSQTEGDNGSDQAGPDNRQKELTDLREYVNYNITIRASTSKGDGPESSPAIVARTDQDKPSAAPLNVRGHNTSSTSILVEWGKVPAFDQNGTVTGYIITYRSQTEGHAGSAIASANDIQKELTGLREYVDYNITVLASTSKGGGPESIPIVVRTDQDKPFAAPSNIRGRNTSSTSILVEWGEVPSADQNGVILTYTISYQSLTQNDNDNKIVNYSKKQVELTGLKKFVNYSITLFASTVKGNGYPSDPIFVTTDQDKPTAAPLNVTGHNTSSTSILVKWDDVSAFDQNGIITGYNITYSSRTEGHNGFASTGPTDRQNELTGLREYVIYDIRILASTSKGDGPNSSPIVVRTDQDKPFAAPSHIRGRNTSSTSILVEWGEVPSADQNGVILTYTISYQSLTQNDNDNKIVNYSKKQVELTGLKKFVNYSITLFASTVKGNGDHSDPIFVTTDQDKPTAAPLNVTGHNTSSTSILVKWDDVSAFDQNGIITGYNITYSSRTEGHNGFASTGPTDRQNELTGLREYVIYDIRILASTSKGDGPNSSPIVVRTDQDKPSAPPSNIGGRKTSSTSILVEWGEVPPADQNGVILTYTISYQSLTQTDHGSETVDYSKTQFELTVLKKFVNYSITLFASTVKGNGNRSDPIFVITDQDKPTAAPSNVRGRNTSSTSILVEWDDVPAFEQNGIITNYTIFYRSQTEGHNGSAQAGPDNRQKELTDLRKYVNYNITIRASTSKGDGPDSSPAIVVRTDQDKPSGAPQNLSLVNTTSTSILVLWDEVLSAEQNGIIVSYNVSYRAILENGSVGAIMYELVDAPKMYVSLTGLTKDMHYSISVLASTIKGDGIYSNP
ncbi:protein sidekick-1-like isoform X3 [Stylophora pistillata]|uniref:protein sidekick-1-like isoform X3 n=1 Tax=Stylophora pistillata TaxID=50429 RepID=UPI000C04F16C|nr:protein sidekick-1-like isoform X3 [Stylophora pistillata]